MELAQKTACELKRMIQTGQVSCREVMTSVLDTIEKREPVVQAYLRALDRAELLARADATDKKNARGEDIGILGGLPIAIKDNICTKGISTTCASKILGNFIPPYDATVAQRIAEAGGIVIGKTNMDEFAMGSSTENSGMKLTRNPHDPERVPGGSSGGSAAAVAAHEAVMALGSDTGGSVRQPAALCGIVGVKPTYGRVSRFGLIAFGSSLDQIGPLTKDVSDAALLMQVISGHDPKDSTSINADVPDFMECAGNDRNLTVGLPREFFGEGLDPEVGKSVKDAVGLLEKAGCKVVEVSLPNAGYSIAVYYICACAEASSNLARYDGCHYGYRAEGVDNIVEMYCRSRSEGFGPEVKRRIMLGTYALSSGYYDAYYMKAAKVRKLISLDYEAAFAKCDVVIHPTTPTPAFKIGDKTENPLAMYLCDIYTVTANLAGIPAISLPCGRTSSGLPIGLHIAAAHMGEKTMFEAAGKVERLLAEAGKWKL